MVRNGNALVCLLAAAVALSGCVPLSRDLQNPQTQEAATCTLWRPVYGDFIQTPNSPYCRCILGHLAAGYQLVGEPKHTECEIAPHV